MPNRTPLAPGKETPSFVEGMLQGFGKNPYGEPMYRLIWSSRPQNFLIDGLVPTYEYLDPPRWIIEKWLDAGQFHGPREAWGPMQEALMGEYPSEGVYFICDPQMPVDWEPTEKHVGQVVRALIDTMEADVKARRNARVDEMQRSERESVREVADEIVESFTSAEHGRIQQPVSGPRNNFRTADDFQRDAERVDWSSIPQIDLPRSGGKIYQPKG